jgi:hypothetical protein
MTRKLTLRRESLTELTATELGSVVGGQVTLVCLPTHQCTGYYPSINAPCTTV